MTNSITTTKTYATLIDSIGKRARIDLENGDSYYGVIAHVAAQQVTVSDYSAWYEGTSSPYDCPFPDDTATFAVTAAARVSVDPAPAPAAITYTNGQGQTVSEVPGQPGRVLTGRPERVEIAERTADDIFAMIPNADEDI